MKTLPSLAIALAGLTYHCPAATDPTAAPPASPDLVFAEHGGLVAFEAEHFGKQELSAKRAWHIFTPTHRPSLPPDTDGTHVLGASGGAYLELLPDTRWTHAEKLIEGENFSREPGKLAVLSYRVAFATPGRYHVWARVLSTGTEDNGIHFGLNGEWPESGRRWQTTLKHRWSWDSRQRTDTVHVGVPGQLWLDVPAAGEHTVQISMREDGVALDKIVLTTDPTYVPEDTGPEPRAKSGRIPAACPVSADYREMPAITPLPPPPAPRAAARVAPTPAASAVAPMPEAGTVSAASLPLEGSGFYLHNNRWAAVDPALNQQAAVVFTPPVANGRYRVTLHAVGENDGNSIYEVLLGGRSLGIFTAPPSKEMFEEGPAFTKTWRGIEVQGEKVEIRARIGSNDGKEWSRARWSKIVFTPESPPPSS